MTAGELPIRWCRFCKEETKQLIGPANENHRVCIACWRRQRDGERVVIADGDDTQQRARDTRPSPPPSSIPPPPPLPRECISRDELHDLMRRIETIERVLQQQGSNGIGIEALTTLYK